MNMVHRDFFREGRRERSPLTKEVAEEKEDYDMENEELRQEVMEETAEKKGTDIMDTHVERQ